MFETEEHGDDPQLEEIISQAKEMHGGEKLQREAVEIALDLSAEADESGERFLTALRAYYEVFFAEEENRIRPALKEGLEKARNLAEGMPFLELLEELSQGVILEEVFKTPNLVLAPSFWGSPLLIFDQLAEDREIILFGARPLEASLVPGEVVPDALLRGLKALSDSTRLRILRYLSGGGAHSLTAVEATAASLVYSSPPPRRFAPGDAGSVPDWGTRKGPALCSAAGGGCELDGIAGCLLRPRGSN